MIVETATQICNMQTSINKKPSCR